jgi:hypothetical protein
VAPSNVCPAFSAPKLSVRGPVQLKSSYESPLPVSWSDWSTGVVSGSETPMSVDCIPAAGPPVAVRTPSYDRNWRTVPPASTRAIPSGLPFWMPLAG